MSAENIFGAIVTGRQVRQAAEAHLKMWVPTYLAEIARAEGIDPTKLPLFRSWVSALEIPDGRFDENQIPSCVIVSPGILEEPENHGGLAIARWALSIGCVVSGRDLESTFNLVEMYAAAVRAAVVQNPSLGGFATASDWLGERYDEIPTDMLQTLAAGSVQFAVEVQGAVDLRGGPDAPLVDPIPDPGPRATFEHVDVSIESV